MNQDAQPTRWGLPAALGDAQAWAVALLLVVLSAVSLLSRLGGEGPAFPIPPQGVAGGSEGLRQVLEVPAAIARRSKPSTPSPLDINLSDAQALQTLPGVGPVLAERIVAYRTSHGPFRTVEELLQVPGIGPTRWGRIRDFVRIGEGA